jgi:hypothetical protein
MMADMDMVTKPLLVNFVGGPGAGKSTLCAGTFSRLKRLGVDCELALEYAKDKVWEESLKVLENQVYVLGKQYQRIYRLAGKVDVILTDSPIFLSLFYGKDHGEGFSKLVMDLWNQYNNLTFFVERPDQYESKGRYQNFSEAKVIDQKISSLLLENNIEYTRVSSSEIAERKVVALIVKLLSGK